ncbi:hypothetical protein J3F83DRAFT_135440 [Trichoderma novae-zelandiae]
MHAMSRYLHHHDSVLMPLLLLLVFSIIFTRRLRQELLFFPTPNQPLWPSAILWFSEIAGIASGNATEYGVRSMATNPLCRSTESTAPSAA